MASIFSSQGSAVYQAALKQAVVATNAELERLKTLYEETSRLKLEVVLAQYALSISTDILSSRETLTAIEEGVINGVHDFTLANLKTELPKHYNKLLVQSGLSHAKEFELSSDRSTWRKQAARLLQKMVFAHKIQGSSDPTDIANYRKVVINAIISYLRVHLKISTGTNNKLDNLQEHLLNLDRKGLGPNETDHTLMALLEELGASSNTKKKLTQFCKVLRRKDWQSTEELTQSLRAKAKQDKTVWGSPTNFQLAITNALECLELANSSSCFSGEPSVASTHVDINLMINLLADIRQEAIDFCIEKFKENWRLQEKQVEDRKTAGPRGLAAAGHYVENHPREFPTQGSKTVYINGHAAQAEREIKKAQQRELARKAKAMRAALEEALPVINSERWGSHSRHQPKLIVLSPTVLPPELTAILQPAQLEKAQGLTQLIDECYGSEQPFTVPAIHKKHQRVQEQYYKLDHIDHDKLIQKLADMAKQEGPLVFDEVDPERDQYRTICAVKAILAKSGFPIELIDVAAQLVTQRPAKAVRALLKPAALKDVQEVWNQLDLFERENASAREVYDALKRCKLQLPLEQMPLRIDGRDSTLGAEIEHSEEQMKACRKKSLESNRQREALESYEADMLQLLRDQVGVALCQYQIKHPGLAGKKFGLHTEKGLDQAEAFYKLLCEEGTDYGQACLLLKNRLEKGTFRDESFNTILMTHLFAEGTGFLDRPTSGTPFSPSATQLAEQAKEKRSAFLEEYTACKTPGWYDGLSTSSEVFLKKVSRPASSILRRVTRQTKTVTERIEPKGEVAKTLSKKHSFFSWTTLLGTNNERRLAKATALETLKPVLASSEARRRSFSNR